MEAERVEYTAHNARIARSSAGSSGSVGNGGHEELLFKVRGADEKELRLATKLYEYAINTYIPNGRLSAWIDEAKDKLDYMTFAERCRYVVFTEIHVGKHHASDKAYVGFDYRVLRADDTTLYEGSVVSVTHTDNIDTKSYNAFLNARVVDERVRINASRYHLLRTCYEVKRVLERKDRWTRLFYTSKYVSLLRTEIDVIRKCRESNTKKKVVRECGIDLCCLNLQAQLREEQRRGIVIAEENMRRRGLLDDDELAEIESADDGAEYRNNLRAYAREKHELKTEKAGKHDSEKRLKNLKYLMQESEGKYGHIVPKVAVSSDAPCFQILNSNVKALDGYARVHVGSSAPPGFKGKLFKETTISDLTRHMRKHVETLRKKEVKGVLLSGDLWSERSKFSGYVLNSALPKVFDGMRVKFLGSSKYAEPVATKVRNYYCELEDADCPDVESDEEIDMIDEMGVPRFDMAEDVPADPDETVLMNVYRAAFVQDSAVDQQLKAQEFHFSPFDEDMPEINMRTSFEEFVPGAAVIDNTYMEPVVKTHMEMRHPVCQQELVYSVYNRNYMPPQEIGLVDASKQAARLFDIFHSTLRKDPKPIAMTDTKRSEYIQKKGTDNIRQLRRLIEEDPLGVHKWFALVKGAAKPTLDDGEAENYGATQVIVCKDKMYNARFGPYFSEIQTFIKRNLKKKYFLYTSDDATGFEDELSRNAHRMVGTLAETDMSKYDKSQGITALLFELLIMEYFGMPEELLCVWYESHIFANIKSITGTTRFQLPVQRKSGDPWTYYGNTMYLMCTLIDVLTAGGLYDINYLMLSGDDSLAWGTFPDSHKRKAVDRLALDYNLDAKIIESDSLYFCSKFMIPYGGRLHLLADPVKVLIKIGKTDVRDRGHVEELRVSLLDYIDGYKHPELRMLCDEAVRERYGYENFSEAMAHIYGFVTRAEFFSRLFADNSRAARLAVIVPYDVPLKIENTKIVWHEMLMRRNLTAYNKMDVSTYMRAIGANAGRRILITYEKDFVPQDCRVLADMRKNYDQRLFEEIIHKSYRS